MKPRFAYPSYPKTLDFDFGKKPRSLSKMGVAIFILFFCLSTHAEKPNVSQTKNKLKQLEAKINTLQQTLTKAHNKNDVVSHKLSQTEKQISLGVNQLRITRQVKAKKQLKIAVLEQQIHSLNNQMHIQQQALAEHLRVRYAMGEEQPLKWLLSQDALSTFSRSLTYYQYIVQSRQEIIQNIQLTKKNIASHQMQLKQEMNENQQLERQLNQHQQKLEEEKLYSTQLIHALTEDIQNTQTTLSEYQQNKENLSHLLNTLAQQSIKQTQQPMSYLHRKIPMPVDVKRNHLKKLNQGIIFFAEEGAPVVAVSSGHIVFCDWLKGYGLLLIIDHGQGFMTLYAHNQSLFKRKGDAVKQGEQIAAVGHSGGLKQNGLYFEIRQQGKAIPPLSWLS